MFIHLLRRSSRGYDLSVWDKVIIIMMLVLLISFLAVLIFCLIALI